MSEHTLKTDNPALREVVALDQYEAVRVRADEAEARIKELEATLTQPETGQPDKYLYDAGYGAGVRDTEARIVALIEAKREAHRAFGGEARNAIDSILTAIQEGEGDE